MNRTLDKLFHESLERQRVVEQHLRNSSAYISVCNKCGYPAGYVSLSELRQGEGVIACDGCGALLDPLVLKIGPHVVSVTTVELEQYWHLGESLEQVAKNIAPEPVTRMTVKDVVGDFVDVPAHLRQYGDDVAFAYHAMAVASYCRDNRVPWPDDEKGHTIHPAG